MKILVNWDYSRKDLMKAFERLSQDIQLIFIYKSAMPQTGPEKVFNQNVLYWNDFKSPYELIKNVFPDKIIFHDIESFLQVSLNIAAKNKGIQTLVLEHGLRGDYEIDIALKPLLPSIITRKEDIRSFDQSISKKKTKSSQWFYFHSFRLKNIKSLLHFLLFPFFRKKYGLTVGLYKCPFNLREADKYINFTYHNASYVIKRDNLPVEKVIPIGNPCFDDLFTEIEKTTNSPANYYLLIDVPYCEQPIFNMKKETKISFYKRLNAFCLLHNSKLKIKLHPQTYEADYLPSDINIEYLKEYNVAELIAKAKGCFIINLSTLSPLVMYYLKCIYFNTGINPYDKELIENKYIPIYDFNSFEQTQLIFKEITAHQKAEIIKTYLYSTDGKATERLKQILLS